MTPTDVCHILVVEDSDEDFAMISKGLSDSGIRQNIEHLATANAVRKWIAGGPSAVSMILLDLNLPGESGTALLAAFKTHPTYAATPVIIFSTSSNPKDVAACYRAGANAYHVKPLETPRFHALVKRIATYWFCDALANPPDQQ